MARAMELPMYQLFHVGNEPPKTPNLLSGGSQVSILSSIVQFNEMARPERVELAPFCLEGAQHKVLSTASGVAY